MTAEHGLLAIFGTGRNGSTLLMRLLDGAPGLWVHPVDIAYLVLFDDLAAGRALRGDSLRTATTRPLRHLDRTVATAELLRLFRSHVDEIDASYLPSLVEPYERNGEPESAFEAERMSAGAFFPAWLEAVRASASRSAAPRYTAFKTSETAYIGEYERVFPALRSLHIIRDPLTNFASLKRTWVDSKKWPFWGVGEDILETFLEARWLPHARTLTDPQLDPARNHIVRYEDLCADPARELAGICAWLGIEPQPGQPIQTVLGGKRMRELPNNASKPGVATPEAVVSDMARMFDYAEVVTRREADLIATVTGDLAAQLGYDSGHPHGRFSLWLRWLPPDASERRNVTRWRLWPGRILRRRAYVTRLLLRTA